MKKSFKQIVESVMNETAQESLGRRFEFCLQNLSNRDEYKTVIEYGETGHEAYGKVRNAKENAGWRIYTWGEFEG